MILAISAGSAPTEISERIVGDACNAATAALVGSFEESRLRYMNRAHNFGEQSRPNNDGLAMATGELIAFLNHDDLWFPDHLASLVAARDALRADLVYAPPVEVDAHGVPRCGLTNAAFRYDPSHFVPASLWLLTRDLAHELGGWRPAGEIHASNPSQDFLVRAWRRTKLIACTPHVTALVLASGGRPRAYVRRDDSQHAALFAAMALPEFREQLLTHMVLSAARDAAVLRRQGGGFRTAAGWACDRMLVAARLHPNAMRNWLARRPKGHWIAHLRAFRGLTVHAAPKPRAGTQPTGTAATADPASTPKGDE